MGNTVSSLHAATVSGDIKNTRRCVELGASPNDPRIAPLHAAALYGRADILKFLIDAGGDVDARVILTETLFPGMPANPFPTGGYTPLGCAILAKSIDCVAVLLGHGASPNRIADEGAPAPFAIAIGSGATRDILEAIARAGVSFSDDGESFALMAAMIGNIDALDVLWARGVSTDPTRAIDALLTKAVESKDRVDCVRATVEWMLGHGGDARAVPNLLERLVAIADRRLFDSVVGELRNSMGLEHFVTCDADQTDTLFK